MGRNAYFVLIGIAILFTACASHPASAATSPQTPTLPAALTPTLTATLALTLTPTPSATSIPATVCSPLAVLSLEQIPAYITQPFSRPDLIHNAEHPTWIQKDGGHHGVDIGYYQVDGKLFTGTPVLAALDGQIAAIVHDRPPYGNMLIVETPFERIPAALVAAQNISTGNSLYSLYAHLQALQALTPGQPIHCGQPLAETGLTGFTGGPHLHFETRWGPPGRTFTSMAYYSADASAEEMSNYETWRMTTIFQIFDPMELLKQANAQP